MLHEFILAMKRKNKTFTNILDLVIFKIHLKISIDEVKKY